MSSISGRDSPVLSADARRAEARKVVAASLIGSTIEWYDFFLYGIVAGLVFNHLYFPSDDPTVGIMLAYATFAVGFVARPFGGLVFGHFGDRVGRKKMLVITLVMMGAATVLIGLVPTYDQIGIAAPLLLLVLRIFQGIGIGGEWGGAVLMAYEYAPENRRGLFASIPQIGLALGLAIASAVTALLSLMPDAAFMAWGWRIAFILSIFLVLTGMWIRMNIDESPEFKEVKQAQAEHAIPFLTLLRTSMRHVMLGMGVRYIDGVAFNILAVFSIVYLTRYAGISRTEALTLVSVAAMVMIVAIPIFGRLSDSWGRPTVYAIGAALLTVIAIPTFHMMASGDTVKAGLGLVIALGIIYPICYGPEAALFADLFPAEIRYTGISFVYQFSGIFASGITPMIATWLMAQGDNTGMLVAGYMMFAGIVSCICAVIIGRDRRRAGL